MCSHVAWPALYLGTEGSEKKPLPTRHEEAMQSGLLRTRPCVGASMTRSQHAGERLSFRCGSLQFRSPFGTCRRPKPSGTPSLARQLSPPVLPPPKSRDPSICRSLARLIPVKSRTATTSCGYGSSGCSSWCAAPHSAHVSRAPLSSHGSHIYVVFHSSMRVLQLMQHSGTCALQCRQRRMASCTISHLQR